MIDSLDLSLMSRETSASDKAHPIFSSRDTTGRQRSRIDTVPSSPSYEFEVFPSYRDGLLAFSSHAPRYNETTSQFERSRKDSSLDVNACGPSHCNLRVKGRRTLKICQEPEKTVGHKVIEELDTAEQLRELTSMLRSCQAQIAQGCTRRLESV